MSRQQQQAFTEAMRGARTPAGALHLIMTYPELPAAMRVLSAVHQGILCDPATLRFAMDHCPIDTPVIVRELVRAGTLTPETREAVLAWMGTSLADLRAGRTALAPDDAQLAAPFHALVALGEQRTLDAAHEALRHARAVLADTPTDLPWPVVTALACGIVRSAPLAPGELARLWPLVRHDSEAATRSVGHQNADAACWDRVLTEEGMVPARAIQALLDVSYVLRDPARRAALWQLARRNPDAITSTFHTRMLAAADPGPELEAALQRANADSLDAVVAGLEQASDAALASLSRQDLACIFSPTPHRAAERHNQLRERALGLLDRVGPARTGRSRTPA